MHLFLTGMLGLPLTRCDMTDATPCKRVELVPSTYTFHPSGLSGFLYQYALASVYKLVPSTRVSFVSQILKPFKPMQVQGRGAEAVRFPGVSSILP